MKRLALGIVLAAGCTTPGGEADYRARAEAAVKSAFAGGHPQTVERVVQQDEAQRVCSEHRDSPPAAFARSITSAQRAAIAYPPSGRLMGDWRAGKKIAEDAGGMRYDDKPGQPNGGNCYACHQLAAAQIAYGTLGPSLLGYGKARGTGEAAQRQTYERIYNAQAFVVCSAMPRFGHNGVLTPEQISHLVALLLDPASEVNQ
jgi:sulfur-oxidizing protein SoxX